MAPTKTKTARVKATAVPETAASTRKPRASSSPKRFVAGEKNPRASPVKSRGRPKGNKVVASGKAGGRVVAAKVVKPKANAATGGKRGRPAKGSSTVADVVKKSKSKGPGPVEVFNDELKNTAAEYQVEKILDSRIIKDKIQYFVKWVGYPESDNSWEPEVNVRNAQEAITAFDIEFPNKDYPEPAAEKPTAAKKKKTPAPHQASVEDEEEADEDEAPALVPVAVMT